MTTSFRADELRIVMMGRTGSGKSALGNTFLGRNHFTSKMSGSSVTQQCEIGELQLPDGRKLVIIDTPGFFDTKTEKEKLAQEISRCVSMSSPGPHAFLFVVSPGRFTDEEVNTVEMFFKMFGREVERYMIVVFTSADQLEAPIDDFIQSSDRLKDLMQKCSNRKYAIDNKTKSRRETQVRELVNHIDVMVGKNGGSYYSNEMYEENAKLLAEQEEKLRLEHERKGREKVKAIEDEVTKKYEGQMSELKQKEVALTNNIKTTQQQLEMVEASLGARSKEADECRRQIAQLIQQKDANNERYQQQLMDMQKEMEARHRNDMATMAKQHQETMKEMRTAISNIKIPRPRGICSIQ